MYLISRYTTGGLSAGASVQRFVGSTEAERLKVQRTYKLVTGADLPDSAMVKIARGERLVARLDGGDTVIVERTT